MSRSYVTFGSFNHVAKIGTIEDIFIDRQTGRPAWAAVSTGLLGRRHTLVPLFDGLLNTNGEVQLPLAKAHVKDAPSITPGEKLTPALERRMCEALRVGRL